VRPLAILLGWGLFGFGLGVDGGRERVLWFPRTAGRVTVRALLNL
jgi:hypothetical protein